MIPLLKMAIPFRQVSIAFLMIAGGFSWGAYSGEVEVPLAVYDFSKTMALSRGDEAHFDKALSDLMRSSAKGDLKTVSMEALKGYLDQSFLYPRLFWGPQHEASSQQILIERLNRFDHQNQEAYGLCLKFRWLSPNIHQFAALCQSIGDALWKENQDQMAGLWRQLERPPWRVTLTGSDALALLTASYQNHPFSEARLRALIQQLLKEDQQDVARTLLVELLEINDEALWNTERGGVYKDLVQLFDVEVPDQRGSLTR